MYTAGMGPFKCYMMQWGDVSNFPEKIVTNVYGSMLLALRGGGYQFSRKTSVT